MSFTVKNYYNFRNRYLVTWSNLGIYMIDPSIGSIVAWNDQIKGYLQFFSKNIQLFMIYDVDL